MRGNYHLQDLVFQDGDKVVYHAHGRDGATHAIIRLKLPTQVIPILAEGSFERTLQELIALKHLCLHPVVDGGLDPVDGYPWVAVLWPPGPLLSERIEAGPLTGAEIKNLEKDANSLINFLGLRAGALSFNPAEIVTTESRHGQSIQTFAIDYWTWFNDRAKNQTPGTGTIASQALRKLVNSLRPVENPPVENPAASPGKPPGNTSMTMPQKAAASSHKRPLARPGKKTSLTGPIITIITLLALMSGGIWLALQRRAQIIAEEQQDAAMREKAKKAASDEKF